MEVFECKYCKSKNLMLESRVNGENVMTANMVALKCADCSKWIKWCPKEDRHFYIKEKEKTFTFTQEQLDQHDLEVRAEERKKVVAELLAWCLLQVEVDLTSTEKAITYSYFIDKLTEMRGGNNER